jgi:hypothetical protein
MPVENLLCFLNVPVHICDTPRPYTFKNWLADFAQCEQS